MYTKGGNLEYVERWKDNQNAKIHNAFDNHHYRAIYAQRLLKKYSRPISSLISSEQYIMRRDRAGEILDRRAMKIVSKNLGHNRLDVIAQSYIYH